MHLLCACLRGISSRARRLKEARWASREALGPSESSLRPLPDRGRRAGDSEVELGAFDSEVELGARRPRSLSSTGGKGGRRRRRAEAKSDHAARPVARPWRFM